MYSALSSSTCLIRSASRPSRPWTSTPILGSGPKRLSPWTTLKSRLGSGSGLLPSNSMARESHIRSMAMFTANSSISTP